MSSYDFDAPRTRSFDAKPFERISFGGIFRSLRRAIVDFDFDAVRTVAGLARRPGATVRRYLGDGRADSLNPVEFALLTSTLYVVVNLWTQLRALVVFGVAVALLVGLLYAFQWYSFSDLGG